MIKKIFSILIFISVFIFSSFAGNDQKIYRTDSQEKQAIDLLAISSGTAMPSSSGPWSQAELRLMLKQIDVNKLSTNEKNIYTSLIKKFDIEKEQRLIFLDPGISISLEFSLHSNKIDFVNPDMIASWSYLGDFNRPTPFITIPISAYIDNSIYLFCEIDGGLNRSLISQTNSIEQGKEVSYNPLAFRTNLLFFPPSKLIDFNMNFPYRGIISAGGEHWSISLGRENISWGPGVSGNLLLGNQIPYHNNLRFAAFSNHLKYVFSYSSFIHPDNYTYSVDGKDYINLFFNQDVPRTGTKAFIAHRGEFRNGPLAISISEAIIYQSDSGSIDLSVFSPLALFHNFYTRGNANSELSLELEYTIVPHLNIYGTILVDEFNFPSEFSDSTAPPPAMGFQLGVKSAWVLNKSIITSSFECVYTDPYLYIRDDGSRNNSGYGINGIIAFPDFINSPSTDINLANYNLQFIGYRFGNDCITFNYTLGYKAYDSWSLDFTATYIIKGVKDKYTRYKLGDTSYAPSTTEGESYLIDVAKKDAVMHVLSLSLDARYYFNAKAFIKAKLTSVTIFNYNNSSTGGTKEDIQLALGISFML